MPKANIFRILSYLEISPFMIRGGSMVICLTLDMKVVSSIPVRDTVIVLKGNWKVLIADEGI